MKHEGNHKLNFACLACVNKHIEHKDRLKAFVKKIANDIDDCVAPGWKIQAGKLLEQIEAENENN